VSDVIKVTFVAFPDGTSIWFESDITYLRKCVDSWKANLSDEKRQEYDAAGVEMVAGQLRMLREDYNRIQSTNQFKWPMEES
jgi:hypothetical protein